MSLEFYWRQFGFCPTCEQTMMQPCLDLRYPRGDRVVFKGNAHKGRERYPYNAEADTSTAEDWDKAGWRVAANVQKRLDDSEATNAHLREALEYAVYRFAGAAIIADGSLRSLLTEAMNRCKAALAGRPDVRVTVEHPNGVTEIIPGIEGYTVRGGMLGPNLIEGQPE